MLVAQSEFIDEIGSFDIVVLDAVFFHHPVIALGGAEFADDENMAG